ncbi:unnamed protein product [Meloidogyne enterolobii]|uniref:Uncharacterized protein n=1 Tax=Meloidogyne enterolobii TaxID=390850 RepID=A0ACB1AD42_MELEN
MAKLLPNHVGIVIMKNFEFALMNRLKDLAIYVEEREENQEGEKSFVKLIYEIEVLNINLRHEKPLAVIGIPMWHAKANKVKHNRKIENIMIHYNINRDEARKKINAKELAKLEINGNAFGNENINRPPLNMYSGSNFLGIPFDLLFCAGGANDRMRDKFLGKEFLKFCLITLLIFLKFVCLCRLYNF